MTSIVVTIAVAIVAAIAAYVARMAHKRCEADAASIREAIASWRACSFDRSHASTSERDCESGFPWEPRASSSSTPSEPMDSSRANSSLCMDTTRVLH